MGVSRIKGITVEIGGDTTKLQTALKGVNTEIKNTQSQLKDVEKLLKLDPGNTELLSQKYRTLQQEIQATKEKLNTLKEASKQADQALKDGTISQEQYDALQREIAETEQSLKSLEQEYKNFGSVQAQQVAAAGEKMKEFGGKVESAGKTLTTHVTLPLAAVGAAGAASFAEVDKTMQLTNKTMGNTAEEAELLNKAMKDAAANSTFGMKDAATATLNFARAGLDAEQAAAALAPAMNLAAGEGGNLDTVSGGLVATINGFHGSFEEAGHYADVFAAACNNSALDVDSLSSAMSVAAPIFSAAGYTVNDAALYMGVMANNGIEADKAANSLKTGLARLVSPAKEGYEAMKQLGIEVTNADGSMKDSVTIQKELHDAFSKLSDQPVLSEIVPWMHHVAVHRPAPQGVVVSVACLYVFLVVLYEPLAVLPRDALHRTIIPLETRRILSHHTFPLPLRHLVLAEPIALRQRHAVLRLVILTSLLGFGAPHHERSGGDVDHLHFRAAGQGEGLRVARL